MSTKRRNYRRTCVKLKQVCSYVFYMKTCLLGISPFSAYLYPPPPSLHIMAQGLLDVILSVTNGSFYVVYILEESCMSCAITVDYYQNAAM